MKLCRHRWQYLSKPSSCTDVECVKCGKINYIVNDRVPIFTKMAFRSTYCWCPECGNDLCRDSFMSENVGVVDYKCSRCERESVWNFAIAPIPILLGSKVSD